MSEDNKPKIRKLRSAVEKGVYVKEAVDKWTEVSRHTRNRRHGGE